MTTRKRIAMRTSEKTRRRRKKTKKSSTQMKRRRMTPTTPLQNNKNPPRTFYMFLLNFRLPPLRLQLSRMIHPPICLHLRPRKRTTPPIEGETVSRNQCRRRTSGHRLASAFLLALLRDYSSSFPTYFWILDFPPGSSFTMHGWEGKSWMEKRKVLHFLDSSPLLTIL